MKRVYVVVEVSVCGEEFLRVVVVFVGLWVIVGSFFNLECLF